jgi:hypothetical protein
MSQASLIAAMSPFRVTEGTSALADISDFDVMIPHNAGSSQFSNQVHAFGRRTAVSHDVAEEHDAPRSALIHIPQDRLKGGKVGMDIGQNGDG